ncbi:MAG TPA: Ig-like domain-containing protein [Gemmatimonadaceae bacterium]|nr:Ig-like domain-containing protein [Gemmatimonadaceae bacterium]
MTGIAVSPTTLGLVVGDSATVTAVLTTTGTPPAGGWAVSWASTDAAVATVSPTGVVVARSAGVAGISASAGGKSAVTVVTVSVAPWVQSISVTGASGLLVGDQTSLSTAIHSIGVAPPGGWPVTWFSDFPNVATVSSSGVVTAVSVGTATIQARAGNGIGYFALRVVQAPMVTGLVITPGTLYLAPGSTGSLVPAFTAIGQPPVGGWPIAWSSVSPAIATVDAAGKVTGISPGTTTIRATSGSQTAGAVIAVSTASGGSASTVTSVSINPTIHAYMVTGKQRTFTASVGANGPPPQAGWTVAWTSSNPAVATVGANGIVTAVSQGITNIAASVGGVSATTALEVVDPPGVIGLRVDQSLGGMTVGDVLTYTATVDMVTGSAPSTGYAVTWTSNNPAVASITPGGLVTAVAKGNATITATGYGKSGSADLDVYAKSTTPPAPPPVITGITSITLNSSTSVIATGGGGSMWTNVVSTTSLPPGLLEWPIVWTSSDPAVVSVPAGPMQMLSFHGLSEGIATITGTLGGKTVTLTVYVATPTAIAVSPSTLSLAVGHQGNLTPAVTASGPLPATGFPVSYQVGSPLVASVSASGVVTALGAGKTRVDVNAWPQTTRMILTVTGPGLTLALTGTSAVKGAIKPFDATTYYLDCPINMTMSATGSGTATWGREEWSYDGGPFVTYPSQYSFQGLTAGSSMIWRVGAIGARAPTPAQVQGFVLTVKYHYAVNASFADYPNGVAPDYVITQAYSCQP